MNGQWLEYYSRICACMVRVEGMKASNAQHPDNQLYTKQDFDAESDALENLGNAIHEARQAGYLD